MTKTKKDCIRILKSYKKNGYFTFFINGSFVSYDDAIKKIYSYIGNEIELYSFQAVDK